MGKLINQQPALTLDEALEKQGHLQDNKLHVNSGDYDHGAGLGSSQLGYKRVTEADLARFLSETRHLSTWRPARPGKPLPNPGIANRLALPGTFRAPNASPFYCAEVLVLAREKNGALVGEDCLNLEDYRSAHDESAVHTLFCMARGRADVPVRAWLAGNERRRKRGVTRLYDGFFTAPRKQRHDLRKDRPLVLP